MSREILYFGQGRKTSHEKLMSMSQKTYEYTSKKLMSMSKNKSNTKSIS